MRSTQSRIQNLLGHRLAIAAFAVSLFGSVIWVFHIPIMLWIGFAILAVIAMSLVLDTYRQGIALRYRMFMKSMRIVKAARQFGRVSPGVRFLHSCALLMIFAAVGHLLITKNAAVFRFASISVLFILAFAGAWELAPTINRLVSRTWAKALGKVFSVTIGVLILYLAATIARQFVQSVTRTNPKYFLEFVGALSALILPLLYLFFGALTIALLALVLISLIGSYFFISQPAKFFVEFLNKDTRTKVKAFWTKICTGRRPPEKLAPLPILQWNDMHLFLRPASLISLVVVCISPLDMMGRHRAQFDNTLKEIFVSLEYHTGGVCVGLPDGARIAYLDGNFVSTAIKKNGTYIFSKAECKDL